MHTLSPAGTKFLSMCGLSLIFVLPGCPEPQKAKPEAPKPAAGQKTSAAQPKKPTSQAAKPLKPIELPPGDGPVAKVNGAEVKRELFNREYRQTVERYQRARHEVKPALRERLKDNIVRRLVDAEIIRQQAKKMGIEITEKERAEKWATHKKRYGSEDAFKAFLERAGTSEDDVKRQFNNNLVREKVFAKVSEGVKLDEKEIKEFYEKNRARYDEPEQVKASHILIRLKPKATAQEKAERKKHAEMILAKAKKKGADFAALASQYGEDPTKSRGGDLGFFTKGRMVKAFEEGVWKLKKNQISALIETQFGFHIVKKMDHKKARKKPYAEVREQIERSLKARKRNTAIREALNNWKKEAKLELIVKGDPKIIAAGRAKPVRPNAARLNKNFSKGQMLKKQLQMKKGLPLTPKDRPVKMRK